jgi:phosphoribosylformimino-5-aminoimidazole carboxamide ribotide isomerase
MFDVRFTLDLVDGRARHAIAGDRSNYGSVVSNAAPALGDDPVALASSARDRLGISSLYVADLDAIVRANTLDVSTIPLNSRQTEDDRLPSNSPGETTVDRLLDLGFDVIVDGGYRTIEEVELAVARLKGRVKLTGRFRPVVGSETFGPPVAELASIVGADAIFYSLDLKRGELVGRAARYSPTRLRGPALVEAWFEMIEVANLRHVIVLDIANVGTASGTALYRDIGPTVRRYADLKVYAAGGLRSIDDLKVCRDEGFAGCLVASAIHSNAIADRVELAMVVNHPTPIDRV